MSSSPSTSNESTPQSSPHRRCSTPNRASPSFTYFNRTSLLGNFNSWFTEIASNPLSILRSIANPFRQGQMSRSTPTSPVSVRRSRSESYKDAFNEWDSDSEVFDKPLANFLNGTPASTLKGKELIELAPFGIVEVENLEKGIGHNFETYRWKNPTWCDSCGDFLWTPVNYENCVNPSSHFQAVSCTNCRYTCHVRCRRSVRIDCQGKKETGTLIKPLENELREVSPLPEPPLLHEKITSYNARLKNKGSGLGITILDSGNFRGFLRVHLNLTRPINVVAGTRPPSIYDIIKEDDESLTACRRTLTSFYMPRDTVKNIHITSENTSLDVIKSMLKKFKVVDNPQKFALYKCFPDPNADGQTLLKRIADQDKPLRIALDWLDSDDKKIVLQENDTADIAWDAFALPELNNFLVILKKEEEEHINQVIMKYATIRREFENVLNVKMIQAQGVVV